MGLEDVIKMFEANNTITGIAQASAKDPSNPKNRHAYAQFMTEYRGMDAAQAQTQAENLLERPEELREYVSHSGEWADEELSKKVEENYAAILAKLSDKAIEVIAVTMPDKSKSYLPLMQIMAEGNPQKIMAALEGLYKYDEWKIYVARLLRRDPEGLSRHLQVSIEAQQEKFRIKNIADEVKEVKDGKETKKYVTNRAKALAYINKTLASYAKNSREKENLYSQLAQVFYGENKKKK